MVTDDKLKLMAEALENWENMAFTTHKAINETVARIQWDTAACPVAKPFLQPIWAWLTASEGERRQTTEACEAGFHNVEADVVNTTHTLNFHRTLHLEGGVGCISDSSQSRHWRLVHKHDDTADA